MKRERTSPLEHEELGWCLIPPYIMARNDLSSTQKIFFGRIQGLTGKKGYCYASNRWLGAQLGLKKETVTSILNQLQSKGLVKVEVLRDGKNEVLERQIFITTPSPIKIGEVPYKNRGGSPIKIGDHIRGRDIKVENSKRSSSPAADEEVPPLPDPDDIPLPMDDEGLPHTEEVANYAPPAPPASNGGKITPSQFDQFWKDYPRHVDKGKAKTAWNKLCAKKGDDRPAWQTISEAIASQKLSERWSEPQFIPHPTTWLNQARWLDDPAEMRSWNNNGNGKRKEEKIPDYGPFSTRMKEGEGEKRYGYLMEEARRKKRERELAREAKASGPTGDTGEA